MTMRILTLSAVALTLGLTAQAAHPPIPYPAKDFTVTDLSGRQTSFFSLKGKVVVCEFLFTTCIHCQNTAKLYTKLQAEFAPLGVQFLGAAFNDEVQGHPDVLRNFISTNGVGYPVGIVPRSTVENYANLSGMERWSVPQIIVIDRKGIVRAQSDPTGTESLSQEAPMRALLDKLVKESGGSAATPEKAAPATKKAPSKDKAKT